MRIKLSFLSLLLVLVVGGSYLFNNSFSASADEGANPQCSCQYPDGGGYGVRKPADGPNDGSKFTCEIKKCWVPVGGSGGVGSEEQNL